MLKQTCMPMPLRVERLQREILVAPVKKEPTQVLHLKAKRSSDALPQRGTASRNGAAEYLWLSSSSNPSPKYGKTANSSVTDLVKTPAGYNINGKTTNSSVTDLVRTSAGYNINGKTTNSSVTDLVKTCADYNINGKTTNSSVTDLVKTPAGYNIRSAIAELEKRRARLFALAHAAEARAQEAEEKCERAENRLEQETNQRLVAEATARVAEEKAHQIEALVLGADARDHNAAERNLVFGFLVYSNKGAKADARKAKSQRPARIEAKSQRPARIEAKSQRPARVEAKSQRPARIEARRKAPCETGAASAAIELTLWKEGEFTSSNLLKSVGDDRACRVTEQKGLGIKHKFIIYGAVITLLVGAYWLLIPAFH